MYEEQFSERLSQLRVNKGVSARDMSLSLGQSAAYINKIENRRALPSMTVFFYICDYFGITPEQFFSFDTALTPEVLDTAQKIQSLNPLDREHLIALVDALYKNCR